jgi:hypothetical protein
MNSLDSLTGDDADSGKLGFLGGFLARLIDGRIKDQGGFRDDDRTTGDDQAGGIGGGGV